MLKNSCIIGEDICIQPGTATNVFYEHPQIDVLALRISYPVFCFMISLPSCHALLARGHIDVPLPLTLEASVLSPFPFAQGRRPW
jgi:hypothetical protein